MPDLFPGGRYFRALLASDDLRVATGFTLKDENGATITLAAGDKVLITGLAFTNGASTCTFTLFYDADADGALDAGEELYKVALNANTGTISSWSTPIAVPPRTSVAGKNEILVIASVASTGGAVALTGFILP